MKTFWVAMIFGGVLFGQDGDRVTVPFSDPNGAKRVKASLLSGSIRVKAHAGKDVIIEARTRSGRPSRREEDTRGMRRIDNFATGLTVEESENVITINAGHMRSADLDISVPAECALKLSSVNNGGISVEGVSGEIDADSLNGSVTLTNVSGAVVAHSLNGKVMVVLNQVRAGKAMSFSTLNGTVDVTLPADVKANVKMKSENGEIWSDFDIQLQPSQRTPVTEGTSGRGKYRVRFDRAMTGTINGGGPEFQFTTLNGAIFIRKK